MMEPRTQDESTTVRVRRRGPPNYSSRRIQFRLLVLVFLVMTVLMMMKEARKPETWQWMWRLGHTTAQDAPSSAAGAPVSDSQAALDTRPERRAAAAEASAEPVVTAPAKEISLQNLLDASLARSLATAQLHGWSSVLDHVGQPRRDRLRLGLWQYRHDQGLDAAAHEQWPDLLDQLTRQWLEYDARARQVVEANRDQLTPDQQQLCREVLSALHVDTQRQLAALAALDGSASLPDDLAAALDQLQQVLDERAWRAVADNTVLRSAEQEAWLRSWELLESPADGAAARGGSPVTFVQLFSQPDAYRSRVVQVSGTARLGYHVASHEQRSGIQGYYVLWLREAHGSNSPIVAYVASLPTGFPPLAERAPGHEGTVLREEVTVTGVFFKRWLYGSRGGLNLAPLILGQITQWTPPPQGPADGGLGALDPMTILYAVLSVALVALALAVWAYRSSRGARRGRAESVRPPSELPPFEMDDEARHTDEGMMQHETPEHD